MRRKTSDFFKKEAKDLNKQLEKYFEEKKVFQSNEENTIRQKRSRNQVIDDRLTEPQIAKKFKLQENTYEKSSFEEDSRKRDNVLENNEIKSEIKQSLERFERINVKYEDKETETFCINNEDEAKDSANIDMKIQDKKPKGPCGRDFFSFECNNICNILANNKRSNSKAEIIGPYDVSIKNFTTEKKIKMKNALLNTSIDVIAEINSLLADKCKNAIDFKEKRFLIKIGSMTPRIYEKVRKLIKKNKK